LFLQSNMGWETLREITGTWNIRTQKIRMSALLHPSKAHTKCACLFSLCLPFTHPHTAASFIRNHKEPTIHFLISEMTLVMASVNFPWSYVSTNRIFFCFVLFFGQAGA
jgi:hypothetical protein